MVSENDIERLSHIVRSIKKIEKYTEDVNLEEFESNEMLQDAIFKNLEIIGEAAYRITDNTKEAFNHIEWRKIEGLRHKLVHDYYKVDLEIIWQTKNKSLPNLLRDVKEILNE